MIKKIITYKYAIGDRSEATCLQLWHSIPMAYKHCLAYSDFLGRLRKSLSERNASKSWQGK